MLRLGNILKMGEPSQIFCLEKLKLTAMEREMDLRRERWQHGGKWRHFLRRWRTWKRNVFFFQSGLWRHREVRTPPTAVSSHSPGAHPPSGCYCEGYRSHLISHHIAKSLGKGKKMFQIIFEIIFSKGIYLKDCHRQLVLTNKWRESIHLDCPFQRDSH